MSIAGAFGYGSQVMRTPWLMASRSSRWIAFSLIALCVIGVTWLWQTLPPTALSWIGYAAMFGVANAFCWLLLVPNQLLLARAAFQLHMPGVRRDVALSGLLYVCIGMAVPIALFPAHALGVGLVLVLSAAGAALMLLLPLSVVLAAWIALSALSRTDGEAVVGHVLAAHPLEWSGIALALSAAGVVWRWRHLVRADAAVMTGWRAPVVTSLHWRRDVWRRAQSDATREPSTWLSVTPDLRRIGPDHPVRSVRIVIGRSYLPQIFTLHSWLLIVVVYSLAALILFHDAFWNASLAQRVLWGTEYGSFLLSLFAVKSVIWRWRAGAAEMSLLALLPGFGGARGARRAVLHAVFGLPAKQLGFLLLAAWAAIAWGHLGMAAALLVLLTQLAWFGLLVAMLPGVMGGRPLSWWRYLLLWAGVGLLVAAGFWLVGRDGGDLRFQVVLEGAAALMGLVLWVLGYRGWTALWRRPHVFLANA